MSDKRNLNYINKDFLIMFTFVGLSKIWSHICHITSYMLDISTIFLIKAQDGKVLKNRFCTHAINTRYLQLDIHIFLLQTFKNNP